MFGPYTVDQYSPNASINCSMDRDATPAMPFMIPMTSVSSTSQNVVKFRHSGIPAFLRDSVHFSTPNFSVTSSSKHFTIVPFMRLHPIRPWRPLLAPFDQIRVVLGEDLAPTGTLQFRYQRKCRSGTVGRPRMVGRNSEVARRLAALPSTTERAGNC